MSTMESVKAQIRTLIDNANETTGNSDATLTDAMNSLMSGYGQGGSSDLVKYVTFMSWDGSIEYGKKPIISGDDCLNPVSIGLFETPTKESTNTQNFAFSGWSLTSGGNANSSALKNVTEDRVVYASFTASVRYYTVNFYDVNTLSKTVQVTYGADASGLCELTKDGYKFNGWLPNVSNVTEDIDTYAQWQESLKLEDASWSTIAEKSADGTASQIWAVGDKKTLSNGWICEIVGFNHDDLADGSGKAGITFAYLRDNGSSDMWSTPYSSGLTSNWSNCNARTVIQYDAPNILGSEVNSVVKSVNKKYYDFANDEIKLCADKTWLFSTIELGFVGDDVKSEGERYEKFSTNKAFGTAYSELVYTRSNGLSVTWWTRSKTASGGNSTYSVSNTGVCTKGTQTDSKKMLVGFCI